MRQNLSVIITTYNQERYLAASVHSVLGQSRSADEVIICVDKSDDLTLEIAQRFERFGVKVISHSKRVGPFLNTASGLSIIGRGIVCFLDGDDVWNREKLSRVYDSFHNNPSLVLLTHRHIRCNADLYETGEIDITHRTMQDAMVFDNVERQIILKNAALLKRFWFGSAYCVRSECIDINKFLRISLKFPESSESYFDLVFGPYVASLCDPKAISYDGSISFLYRQHENGSGGGATLNRQLAAIDRLRATNALASNVLLVTGVADNILASYRIYDQELLYLKNLYKRRFIAALGMFVQLSSFFLAEKRLLKELVRLCIVVFLGGKMLIAVKTFIRRIYY